MLEDQLVWLLGSCLEGESEPVNMVTQAGLRDERADITWDVTDDDDAKSSLAGAAQ